MKDNTFTDEELEVALAMLKTPSRRRSALFDPYGVGIMDIDYRGNARRHIPIENINPCGEIPLDPTFTTEYKMLSELDAVNNWVKNYHNEKLEGGNTMFNVNDEVIVVKNEYEQFVNMEGVIKEITKSNNRLTTYGVVVNGLKVGHDLDGKCTFGQGWYFLEDEIDLLHKSKLCRMIEKDESLLKLIKEDSLKTVTKYEVRKNGALTFLTEGTRKVFVYKDGATAPLTLNCISEDDKIVTLHLMEAFRILPMMGLVPVLQTGGMTHVLQSYTQEESDRQEALMFPVVEPTVEDIPVPPVGKIYNSEEELYAELHATKK